MGYVTHESCEMQLLGNLSDFGASNGILLCRGLQNFVRSLVYFGVALTAVRQACNYKGDRVCILQTCRV